MSSSSSSRLSLQRLQQLQKKLPNTGLPVLQLQPELRMRRVRGLSRASRFVSLLLMCGVHFRSVLAHARSTIGNVAMTLGSSSTASAKSEQLREWLTEECLANITNYYQLMSPAQKQMVRRCSSAKLFQHWELCQLDSRHLAPHSTYNPLLTRCAYSEASVRFYGCYNPPLRLSIADSLYIRGRQPAKPPAEAVRLQAFVWTVSMCRPIINDGLWSKRPGAEFMSADGQLFVDNGWRVQHLNLMMRKDVLPS